MPSRKVVRRRRIRGKGFGDFIGNALGGIGAGLGSGVHNLFGNLFGGRKRRAPRKRGGNLMSGLLGTARRVMNPLNAGIINSFGKMLTGGRRRVGRPKRRGGVRRRRGGAAEDAPKLGTLGKINKILKDSRVISSALNEFGMNPLGLGTAAATLGYGRRRRRRGGMVHSMEYRRPMMGGGQLNF